MLAAGGIFAHPANDAHHVWTKDEDAVVQIQFIGSGGHRFHQLGGRFAKTIGR